MNFLKNSLPPRWRCTDFVLITFVLLLAASMVVLYKPGAAENVVISVNGKAIASYPLAGDVQEVRVQGTLGPVTVRLGQDGARIIESLCPHQLCVKQGAIHGGGQTIICLPNHLAVEITGPDSGRTDAVAY